MSSSKLFAVCALSRYKSRVAGSWVDTGFDASRNPVSASLRYVPLSAVAVVLGKVPMVPIT